MLSEMILSITDRVAERVSLVGGGFVGSIYAFATGSKPLKIDGILLLMNWEQILDIVLTAAIGAFVGWTISHVLNMIRKRLKRKKK